MLLFSNGCCYCSRRYFHVFIVVVVAIDISSVVIIDFDILVLLFGASCFYSRLNGFVVVVDCSVVAFDVIDSAVVIFAVFDVSSWLL